MKKLSIMLLLLLTFIVQVNAEDIVHADREDIIVSRIAIQESNVTKFVGELSLKALPGEFVPPDPEKEIYILVVRELPEDINSMVNKAGLQIGKAYRWFGGQDFSYIRDIDLSLSDDEIAKIFGVGSPNDFDHLRTAAEEGEISKVMKYTEAGLDLNNRDSVGLAALHYGARNGHLEIVRYLIENGAEVDLPGMNDGTALSSAVGFGHKKVVDYLLSIGANVNQRNIYGDTALHVAAYHDNRVYIIKKLIDHGAIKSAKNKKGRTPLDIYNFYRSGKIHEMVELLSE